MNIKCQTYIVYVNGIENIAIVTSETARLMRNNRRSPDDLEQPEILMSKISGTILCSSWFAPPGVRRM